MKSHHFDMGNINMKGKKSYRFSCGCCGEALDKRDFEWKKLLKQEINAVFLLGENTAFQAVGDGSNPSYRSI